MDTHTSEIQRPGVPCGWANGLDVHAVLAAQGFDAWEARLPAPFHAAAARVLAEGRLLLAPAVATRRLAGGPSGPIGAVAAGRLPPAVAQRLSGSSEILLVVCTVGSATDRKAKEVISRDPVLALAYEGLGTAAIDRLAAAVCAGAREQAARRGFRMTAAASPGQVDWDLGEGQRWMFGLVAPGCIGVTLNANAQMQPCKSMSFMVGLGAEVEDEPRDACGLCGGAQRCRWRPAHRRLRHDAKAAFPEDSLTCDHQSNC